MPIYDFACPRCRVIFSFLSRRLNPTQGPACPKCGGRRMRKEVTGFALLQGGDAAGCEVEGAGEEAGAEPPMPDLDNPRVMRAMEQMERDMERMDENNPRHVAQMLRRMKELVPEGSLPRDFDVALKRLEAGEDPDRIEQEMGDLLQQCGPGLRRPGRSARRKALPYRRDPGLYEYNQP